MLQAFYLSVEFINLLPQWSDKPCAPHLIPRDREQVWTQQELKERLFHEIICYLDKGKVSINCSACEQVSDVHI